jgi:regulator of nucleoside diphosphate kinase
MSRSKLKPVVMIEDDYRKLKQYAGTLSKGAPQSLAHELERAEIVLKSSFPSNAIRLYSQVALIERRSKKRISFVIVLPEEADIKQQKISALAPVAVAVIGFRQGEEVACKLPGGTRRFLIDEVVNDSAA